MRQWWLALLVLASPLWVPAKAVACDCGVPPIGIAIAQADVILTGSVTRIEVTEVTGVHRIAVDVRERFKGQPGHNFTIYSHPFGVSCLGYDFRVGREYVVFAMVNNNKSELFQIPGAPRTGHLVYLCSGTADLANAVGNRRLLEVRQSLKPKR
jgi:hypothetical protein